MKFKIFTKKPQTQSNVIQQMVKINSEMSNIEELKNEEMENAPSPG